MRDFESQVRKAVENGEVVNFRAIPIYKGSNPIPNGVTLTARGSGGFDLDVSIPNINGLVQ
jgi:filamentous hemagglutinin